MISIFSNQPFVSMCVSEIRVIQYPKAYQSKSILNIILSLSSFFVPSHCWNYESCGAVLFVCLVRELKSVLCLVVSKQHKLKVFMNRPLKCWFYEANHFKWHFISIKVPVKSVKPRPGSLGVWPRLWVTEEFEFGCSSLQANQCVDRSYSSRWSTAISANTVIMAEM